MLVVEGYSDVPSMRATGDARIYLYSACAKPCNANLFEVAYDVLNPRYS